MHESLEDDAITLHKATVGAMFGCVKKAIMFVGDTSAQISSKRREQVLTKLNPVLASLGKEAFPDLGKQLFGDGFEARLKLRSETANTVTDAKKADKTFFRGTAPRRFQGRPQGFHQTVKTSLIYTETETDSSHSIPRRYPSHGTLSRSGPSACCLDSRSFGRTLSSNPTNLTRL